MYTLFAEYRGLVFLGETGSGKTELALNAALSLAKKRSVTFFDMDQTKPLFRSRDAGQVLERSGIMLKFSPQLLDTPAVSGGVLASLSDPHTYPVFDVGGGLSGARMMGQFLRGGRAAGVAVIYVLNIFRPRSRHPDSVRPTMHSILAGSGASDVHIVLNPNRGASTTPDDVMQGAHDSIALLHTLGLSAAALAVTHDLCAAVESRLPIVPVRPLLGDLYGLD